MRQKILYDTRILEVAKEHSAPVRFFVPSEHAEPSDELKFILTAVGVKRDHIHPFEGDYVNEVKSASLGEARILVKDDKGVIRFDAPLEVVGLKGKLFPIEPQGLSEFSVEIVFAGAYHAKWATEIRVYLSCLLTN